MYINDHGREGIRPAFLCRCQRRSLRNDFMAVARNEGGHPIHAPCMTTVPQSPTSHLRNFVQLQYTCSQNRATGHHSLMCTAPLAEEFLCPHTTSSSLTTARQRSRLDTLLCLLTKCINGLHSPGGPCLNTQELSSVESVQFSCLVRIFQGVKMLP